MEHWKKTSPTSSFYFRPYGREVSENDNANANANDENNHGEIAHGAETILYVHQEEWQKDLLVKFGNTITLMDATYKTTKYSIPLFFLCVKTNVNYSIVAEFVVQSETTDMIFEALSVIKLWNPGWNPDFFITDYSDAEMGAIKRLLPIILNYIYVIFTGNRRGRGG